MLVAFAASAPVAPLASATPAHVYSFSFSGSGAHALSEPVDVAVDNSHGPSARDVYVTDPRHHRVEKFDPDGNFILMFGDGVNQTTGGDVCTGASGDLCKAGAPPSEYGDPGAFNWPSLIAVDGSGGPSAGDVYVGDWSGPERLMKFDPSGRLITSWGEGGQIVTGLYGIAVDRNGNLFAEGYYETQKYSQAGVQLSSFKTAGGSDWIGIGIDSADHLYRATSYPSSAIEKLTTAGVDLGRVDGRGDAIGLAVDPSTGEVYVNRRPGAIDRFAANCPLPDCSPLIGFGEGLLNTAGHFQGVAVDASSHTVYAVNPLGLDGEVAVFFAPGRLPQVVTGSTKSAGTATATVTGWIDPAGAAVRSCRFAYVDDASFRRDDYGDAKVASCRKGPPYSGATQVSANLSLLRKGTTYHYRIIGSNENGSGRGADRAFTTAAPPAVRTGSVSGVDLSAATLTGSVDPGGAGPVTLCRFDYVSEARFRADGYGQAQSVPCFNVTPYWLPTNVRAALSGLRPRTTYHYRIVAANAQGTVDGVDLTFRTLSKALVREPRPPIRRPTNVACSKQACTRTLDGSPGRRTWRSPRFPPTYGWLFSVYWKDKALRLTQVEDGCRGTFRGHGVVVSVDGCNGRFELAYRGSVRFRIRWRVFAHCKCAKHTERSRPH
jgi:hypothetical protein